MVPKDEHAMFVAQFIDLMDEELYIAKNDQNIIHRSDGNINVSFSIKKG